MRTKRIPKIFLRDAELSQDLFSCINLHNKGTISREYHAREAKLYTVYMRKIKKKHGEPEDNTYTFQYPTRN